VAEKGMNRPGIGRARLIIATESEQNYLFLEVHCVAA
jgi:hypothetical protein